MDWFEEWFNSPLYERLYADRDESEAKRLISFLEQTLQLHRCANILDLGCGRGRHAISLARKGYNVTGLDLSEQAIITAKEKAALTNQQERLRFIRGDMRNALDETFDAVLNLFTTFGYFLDDEENAKVLDSARKMLKLNGILVLDYLNAPHVKETLVPEDEGKFQDIDYSIRRYIRDGAVYKEIHFKRGEKERTYSERVKLYELEWFKQKMGERNLAIDHVYGDYYGNAYDKMESPRLLLICHKKK